MEKMESVLQCDSCTLNFDLRDRLPKIMPCCGTTFCLECITNVLVADQEAQIEQVNADGTQAAYCKKCINCN